MKQTSKQIYIYRHGETDLNRLKIVQGSGVDASLNELGRKQGKAFYDFYKGQEFEVVLTSGLVRTHETAAPFIEQGIPWEQWKEINEIGWGVHEGKQSEVWMIEAYKNMIQEWDRGNFDASLEEGESAAQLAHRLGIFVDQLKERKEERILICSHGRAIRCLMCVLNGEHLREMENYHHANTGLYQFSYQQGQFEMVLRNDTRHLESFKTN